MHSGATILAVDDDRSILGLLEHALRDAGFPKQPIHLLLTDVIMPDLTGPVLAERLRSHQPDLQVLFISGFHDADLVQRFVTAKGFTLLPKPFTIDALLRVVQESLNGIQR